MNIKDINTKASSKSLDDVFNKQKELIEKYKEIEKYPRIRDIDNREFQLFMKELTFRGVEELSEAYEAYVKNNIEHFEEELSDALHFFTELLIFLGVKPSMVYDCQDNFEHTFKSKINNIIFETMHLFSLSCNCLKLKPWKQTDVHTDESKYLIQVIYAYCSFLHSLELYGIAQDKIFELYDKKNSVNKFRIKSKY